MSYPLSSYLWGTTPTASVELPKEAAAIKGEVYINNIESSQIRQDRWFEFSKRLRDEKGDPIPIEEDDLYLSLEGKIETVGTFSNQTFTFRSKIGYNWNRLPASLFEKVKEGGVVRFYWDDQLVELTCRQKTLPECCKFETLLTGIKGQNNYSFLPVSPEDEYNDYQFMPQETADDQMNHGPYRKLKVLSAGPNCVLFDLVWREYRVDISEIQLIKPKDTRGLQTYWIIIPHKPEYKDPEGAICEVYDEKSKEWMRDPEGTLYHHGQYYMFKLRDAYDVKLSFRGDPICEGFFLHLDMEFCR